MSDSSPIFTEYRDPLEIVASKVSTKYSNSSRENPSDPPTDPISIPISLLSPMVILTYYPIVAMLELGTGGTPEFISKDATYFIQRIEGIYKRYRLVRDK